MKKLKEFFYEIYEFLKPVLLLLLLFSCIAVSFSALGFFICNVEKSKLDEVRYCPSCGIDLINK